MLLVSGGHCLLAVVRSVDDFLLIGKGVDDAPGDAFDKVVSLTTILLHCCTTLEYFVFHIVSSFMSACKKPFGAVEILQ